MVPKYGRDEWCKHCKHFLTHLGNEPCESCVFELTRDWDEEAPLHFEEKKGGE